MNYSETPKKGERIAKIIARAGICSRREAEKIIESGRVSVNGRRTDSAALNCMPEDKICIDGKEIPQSQESRLWLYYKPVGLVTSHKDEQGRKTVFDSLPDYLPRLISVGRLDLNSEGLLLLTNNGNLSRHMELPETGWKRCYRVRVYGLETPELLKKLAGGVTVDGIRYGKIEAVIENNKPEGKNLWVLVTLTEGKNREIRKVFEYIGCKVSRLIRISYGPFQLGNLQPGEIKEVPRNVVLEQLGNA